MKYWWIVIVLWLFSGCLREKMKGDDCFPRISFIMKDVPYVFVDSSAVAYRSYYAFVEQLNAFVFLDQKPVQEFKYDFNYCREHPVITQAVEYNSSQVLWVANLYDPRELSWSYEQDRLLATFSIVDAEEPPVLLAAISDLYGGQDSVPVELRMLVSRLEIRLVNPPAWMNGMAVTVRNIAKSVNTDYVLKDTTHIWKQLFFDNQGTGNYGFGVNTFPTYPQRVALLTIEPIGTSEASPILVEDSRLHLLPGVVTRLNIVYDSEEKISIQIEIDGKWEIIEGGHIII